MILVGDIGGTNARLALAQRVSGRWRLAHLRVFPTVAADLPAQVRAYRAALNGERIDAFGCCGAGPPDERGRIALSNATAVLDRATLAAAARTDTVVLANDFAAVAHAIAQLGPADLRACGGGEPPPQRARVVLGPGTGLGVAVLAPGAPWTVLPGEGGNVDLAPADDEEYELLGRLRAAHGRVSAETVLSGPGLERLYAAIAPGRALHAQEIAEAAWSGVPEARRAVDRFTRWLGHFAGRLALTVDAGAVYLAGGIVPAWGERFDVAAFRAGFADQPRFARRLQGIACFVVTAPEPGLVGMAALAEAALREH